MIKSQELTVCHSVTHIRTKCFAKVENKVARSKTTVHTNTRKWQTTLSIIMKHKMLNWGKAIAILEQYINNVKTLKFLNQLNTTLKPQLGEKPHTL